MISKNFTKNLNSWYSKNKRDLPWRKNKDPYRIWISEMMLQQTSVNAVIPYFTKWFKIFPTIHHLAKASQEKVLKTWQGLGYYNRARNLHATAKIIVNEYSGILPQDPLLIRKLPGFGPYATAAVLSIAYEIPLVVIDTNVRRVFMRLLNIAGYANSSIDNKISPELNHLIPLKEIGNFNQALMELGALICRSKEPLCVMCPVHKYCQSFKMNTQETIPQTKFKAISKINAVIAIIRHKNKYFIQQRPKSGLLANLWEFPGGKIEKGETARFALKREVKEELSCSIKHASFMFNTTHFYTQFRVNLSVWSVTLDTYPKSDQFHKWVDWHGFRKYPMPSGSAKIVLKLSHEI